MKQISMYRVSQKVVPLISCSVLKNKLYKSPLHSTGITWYKIIWSFNSICFNFTFYLNVLHDWNSRNRKTQLFLVFQKKKSTKNETCARHCNEHGIKTVKRGSSGIDKQEILTNVVLYCF